jgi:hypothetical protein
MAYREPICALFSSTRIAASGASLAILPSGSAMLRRAHGLPRLVNAKVSQRPIAGYRQQRAAS